MARKKLDEMNNGELYKHYRKTTYVAKGGKWASVIAPFGIVFGLKVKEYVEILGDQSWRLTIGCVLAIIVAIIAIYKEIKHDESTKHLSSVVGWGLAFGLIWLLEVVTKDLKLIVGAEFAGQVVSKGFEYWELFSIGESKEFKELSRKDGTLHQSRLAKKVSHVKERIQKEEERIENSRRRATE